MRVPILSGGKHFHPSEGHSSPNPSMQEGLEELHWQFKQSVRYLLEKCKDLEHRGCISVLALHRIIKGCLYMCVFYTNHSFGTCCIFIFMERHGGLAKPVTTCIGSVTSLLR